MSTIAAVFGSPISHSLSPAIHNAAFAAAQRSGEYVAVECGLDDVETTMENLQSAGLVGLSVTMPLKEAVIDYLDFVTPDADFLNAVNCISFGPNGSIGHNTDEVATRSELGCLGRVAHDLLAQHAHSHRLVAELTVPSGDVPGVAQKHVFFSCKVPTAGRRAIERGRSWRFVKV